MTDERSSERLATIAGKVIAMSDAEVVSFAQREPQSIRSLAASVLTQAADRPADPTEGS